MEQGSLAGKVVVVTGAARGLGREYARHLARQGALVTAADIRDVDETVAEITADGGRALAVTVDVGDEASTAAMAAATVDAFGRIDGLVNNAALYGGLSGGRFDQLPESDWQKVMDINVNGVFYVLQAVANIMAADGGGVIVNTASMAAHSG